MITLWGMQLKQKGLKVYLTSATVEQLRRWMDEDRIYPDIWKREKPEGYQRSPDPKRFEKIADYLEGKLRIEETIFPNSIILNLRQQGVVDFEAFEDVKTSKTIKLGKIKIHDEALPFYEVDGQHRIRGLIEALAHTEIESPAESSEIKLYPVPLTIIEGLDRPTEAIQFVVINTTQKKVDPALVLRILHKRYKDKGERLEFFLKGQAWRLLAIELTDDLNSNPDSPWCDKITAPGDDRKGRVISEQNFVSTLETVYRKMEHSDTKKLLPLYWKAVAAVWKECVGENASGYSLQRSNGTYVFHWFFPFVYFKSVSTGQPNIKNFIKILEPVRKKYPPNFWKRGGEAKIYTSIGSQRQLVDKMVQGTFPRGKKFQLQKLNKKLRLSPAKNIWDHALKLIPLRLHQLFNKDKIDTIDGGATGAYILYSFTKHAFYVGRSQKADLKDRLLNHVVKHPSEFHIFNYRHCKNPEEAHDLECALYHLLPHNFLINKEHPSSLEGKRCPFCVD